MHRSILFPRLVAFVLCAALLAGCQTLGGAGLVPSSATAQLTPEAASSIAGDMVGRFAEQVGPGTTTIQLEPDGSIFGAALESSLKGWGYAVATDQVTEGTNTVGLAYVVDAFEGNVTDTIQIRMITANELDEDGLFRLKVMIETAGQNAGGVGDLLQ